MKLSLLPLIFLILLLPGEKLFADEKEENPYAVLHSPGTDILNSIEALAVKANSEYTSSYSLLGDVTVGTLAAWETSKWLDGISLESWPGIYKLGVCVHIAGCAVVTKYAIESLEWEWTSGIRSFLKRMDPFSADKRLLTLLEKTKQDGFRFMPEDVAHLRDKMPNVACEKALDALVELK